MEKKNNAEIAVTSQTAAGTGLALAQNIVGQVLLPADLTALDTLITALGQKSAKLAPDEKNTAIKIVEDWDKSVTERIRTNASAAREVLSFLEGQPMSSDAVDRCIELFHETFGPSHEYDMYIAAMNANIAIRQDKPVKNAVTSTMTVEAADQARADNYMDELRWSRQVSEADAVYARAVKAYVKSILDKPETRDAMSKLQNYTRKATRLAAECSDKAAKAKINISISDQDTRNLLHELMDFAKKF